MFRRYGRRAVEALLLVVVIGVVPAAAAFGDAGPARNGARWWPRSRSVRTWWT
jgi:hypothetical protein